MKIWKKYKEYLLSGEWHVHTNYTDGKNSVLEYCEKANELGIPLIAFTEHVRRHLNYDFNRFLEDIEEAREKFPELIILSGCETKVLPDGRLDFNKQISRKIDYLIFAFHSFPIQFDLYIKCLKKAIENEFTSAWAHPGRFLRDYKLKINEKTLSHIFRLLKKNSVLLEINRKYNLPPRYWKDILERNGICLVNGNDIHNLKEIVKFNNKIA